MHISWHVAWGSGGVVVGVVLAGVLHIGTLGGLWLILAGVALSVVIISRRRYFAVGALAAGLMLGLWRGGLEQHALLAYAPLYGHAVEIRGIVSDDTSYGPSGDQRLRITDIRLNGQPVHGQIWASTVSHINLRRSDIVTLAGKLNAGFGNVPASMFYARVVQIARPQPGNLMLRLRDWFSSGIHKAIPEPQASLGAGYLLGQRSALPPTLDNNLKIVGLTHAVVASGYNLTILVALARRGLLRTSKYLATLAAATTAGGFMLVTGLSPSMTRAGLVTGLSLAAWYYGRTIHPLVLLPIAAAITVLFNPAYAWGDLGWELSFASFAGVIVLAPLLHRYFWGAGQPGFFRQILVDTMAAQLATLPIMIFAFGHYSPYALIANLLVLPLIPLAMLLTFVAGMASLALPGAAHIVGWPATLVLHYMTSTIDYIANLPGAQGVLTFGVRTAGLCYVALVLLAIWLWLKTNFRFRTIEHNQTGGEI